MTDNINDCRRKYSKNTSPVDWSYSGFLGEMKPLILIEDSKELPAKRYICAVRDIVAENDKSDEHSELIRHLGTLLLNQVHRPYSGKHASLRG